MNEKISSSLSAHVVPIASLKPDPKNARKHPERNLSAIKDSLQSFGQQKPVVVRPDGTIIAGNGLVEAAKLLGWENVAAVVTELDDRNATAFGIADNRTAELADWDYTVLAELMGAENGIDWKGLGFADVDTAFARTVAAGGDPLLDSAFSEDVGLAMAQREKCPTCGRPLKRKRSASPT